jgi:uncharacterized protein YegP (UPF0339 family)
MTFEIYRDARGEFRARLVARNGKIIASTEGYSRKRGAIRAIALMKASAEAAVKDLTKL